MSRREERRAKRVDDHRLKKWDQISERKEVFLQMTELTSQSILDMISQGLSEPTGYTVDRDLDDSDYIFNTPLFKSELARYLSTIVATEAEYQDPDGVDELVQLAEHAQFPISYNLPNTVLESHAILETGDVITVSENNLRTYDDEAPQIDLALVAETSLLPSELQTIVTSELTCAQKIYSKAHVPALVIEPCSNGKLADDITFSLDQQPIDIVDSDGLRKLPVVDGFCYPPSHNYKYPYRERILKREDVPVEERPYWTPGTTVIKPLSRKKRGCICRTILFKYPSLLRERSILRSLTMTGVEPPKNDHICFRLRRVFDEASCRSGPDI